MAICQQCGKESENSADIECNCQSAASRPFQFSLWTLVVCFLAAGVVLGLVGRFAKLVGSFGN